MSPDVELSLREQFPDLLVAGTLLSVPDTWGPIVENMLLDIRRLVGDGHCRIDEISQDAEGGFMRTRLRGEQLPTRTRGRVSAAALKGRWHSAQTREFMLLKFPTLVDQDAIVAIPVPWHIPVREALTNLLAVATSADEGYRITAIATVDGHLDVRDNRADVSASQALLDFADTTLASANDIITGTVEKVHAASVLPPKM